MLRQKIALVHETRARSEPLPQGSAPYTSSTHFRTQKCGSKPKAKFLDRRFSNRSSPNNASTLKAAARSLNDSNMISLGTARPSPQYFPWESISMHETKYDRYSDNSIVGLAATMSCSKGEEAYDLSVALNYGYAAGSPQLLRFVTEHVEMIHNPAYDDWETCLTCGTTSALEIVFRTFCKPNDWILVEDYTYSGTLDSAKNQSLNVMGIRMDGEGLLPDDLDFKLRAWDSCAGPKPFVLYTIPSGHNPTGATQSTERRKAIYQVAEKHDLYIVEDDPYHFLQLGNACEYFDGKRPQTSLDGYLDRLPASYLSLDVSGRVVRLDTTSKILAPGLRCGWLTACSQVVQKFLSYTEVSTVSPSGPSQLMMYKLLDETWGHEGFVSWLRHLSLEYRQRRDIMLEACDAHLSNNICHWTVPAAGMFLWIQIDWSRHPLFQSQAPLNETQSLLLEIEDKIYTKSKKIGVLVSKGSWFATEKFQPSGLCFRMTFAAAPEDALERAIARFGAVLRADFKVEEHLESHSQAQPGMDAPRD